MFDHYPPVSQRRKLSQLHGPATLRPVPHPVRDVEPGDVLRIDGVAVHVAAFVTHEKLPAIRLSDGRIVTRDELQSWVIANRLQIVRPVARAS